MSFCAIIQKMSKKILFIIFSLILRWPVWVVLFLLRPFKLFSYIFLVYPGTKEDLNRYCPRYIKDSKFLDAKLSIIGYARMGVCGRGLILGVPNFINEFTESKKLSQKLVNNLEFVKRLSGVKTVAMAGQLPGVIYKHDINLRQSFVTGTRGTVFSIVETINQVFLKHNLLKDREQIVLVGVGYVGSRLINTLEKLNFRIKGVDIKRASEAVILAKDSDELLKEAKVVIVLTPKGSNFLPYIKKINRRAIIVDDTHPKIKITEIDNSYTFFKVAIGMKNVEFVPRLPGYKTDWIPGCVVEAMHVASTGNYGDFDQIKFNKQARKLGFYAHLVK